MENNYSNVSNSLIPNDFKSGLYTYFIYSGCSSCKSKIVKSVVDNFKDQKIVYITSVKKFKDCLDGVFKSIDYDTKEHVKLKVYTDIDLILLNIINEVVYHTCNVVMIDINKSVYDNNVLSMVDKCKKASLHFNIPIILMIQAPNKPIITQINGPLLNCDLSDIDPILPVNILLDVKDFSRYINISDWTSIISTRITSSIMLTIKKNGAYTFEFSTIDVALNKPDLSSKKSMEGINPNINDLEKCSNSNEEESNENNRVTVFPNHDNSNIIKLSIIKNRKRQEPMPIELVTESLKNIQEQVNGVPIVTGFQNKKYEPSEKYLDFAHRLYNIMIEKSHFDEEYIQDKMGSKDRIIDFIFRNITSNNADNAGMDITKIHVVFKCQYKKHDVSLYKPRIEINNITTSTRVTMFGNAFIYNNFRIRGKYDDKSNTLYLLPEMKDEYLKASLYEIVAYMPIENIYHPEVAFIFIYKFEVNNVIYVSSEDFLKEVYPEAYNDKYKMEIFNGRKNENE